MTVVAAIPAGLAILLWAALLAILLNLHSNDPAGNALAHVYAVFATLALWAVLLVLVSGWVADRFDRRRVTAIFLFARALSAGALALYSALGVTTMWQLYAIAFAFGAADVYVIADFPDNVSAASLAMTVTAAGGAEVKTVVLLTPEEIDQAVGKSVEYKPPKA